MYRFAAAMMGRWRSMTGPPMTSGLVLRSSNDTVSKRMRLQPPGRPAGIHECDRLPGDLCEPQWAAGGRLTGLAADIEEVTTGGRRQRAEGARLFWHIVAVEQLQAVESVQPRVTCCSPRALCCVR